MPQYVVEMVPGDVLYLPPYWWHRVEALDSPSISVSTWSNWAAQRHVDKIERFPLPSALRSEQGYATRLDPRAALSALYLRCVVSLVLRGDVGDEAATTCGSEESYAFIRTVVGSRYMSGMAERERALGCGPEWSESRCPHGRAESDRASVDGIVTEARELAGVFALIPGESVYRNGTIGLLLGDFLERAAGEVFGPARVCPFLRCAALPTAWAD